MRALDAKAVAERLQCTPKHAIVIMAELGAANIAGPNAKNRRLRLPEDTLEAFLRGEIDRGAATTARPPANKPAKPRAATGRKPKINPLYAQYLDADGRIPRRKAGN